MTTAPVVDLTSEFWRLKADRPTIVEQNGGRLHIDHMLKVLRARLVVDLSEGSGERVVSRSTTPSAAAMTGHEPTVLVPTALSTPARVEVER